MPAWFVSQAFARTRIIGLGCRPACRPSGGFTEAIAGIDPSRLDKRHRLFVPASLSKTLIAWAKEKAGRSPAF